LHIPVVLITPPGQDADNISDGRGVRAEALRDVALRRLDISVGSFIDRERLFLKMIVALCPLSALKVTTGEVRSSADIRTSPSNVDQDDHRMSASRMSRFGDRPTPAS